MLRRGSNIPKSMVSKNNAMIHRSLASEATPKSIDDIKKTALYDLHVELGGDMVSFAGYQLPVLYKGDNGGVMKEHLHCRTYGKSSLFDVSHMGQVRINISLNSNNFKINKLTKLKMKDPMAWQRPRKIFRKDSGRRYKGIKRKR